MNKSYLNILKKDEKKILTQISIRENVLKSFKTVREYLNLIYTKEHQLQWKPEKRK